MGVWVCGCMGVKVWVYECTGEVWIMGVWEYGCMGVCVRCGCMGEGVWVRRSVWCMGVWVRVCGCGFVGI